MFRLSHYFIFTVTFFLAGAAALADDDIGIIWVGSPGIRESGSAIMDRGQLHPGHNSGVRYVFPRHVSHGSINKTTTQSSGSLASSKFVQTINSNLDFTAATF